jgi:O-antigen ligase
VFKHPITIALLINLLWLLITTIASEYPLVSIKYFLSRFWYEVVFYFLGIMLFRRFKNITKYYWLYMISLFGVVVFTLIKHSKYNFSLGRSYTVIEPFFRDHGVYAATISLLIPLLVCYIFFYKKMGLNLLGLGFSVLLLVVFLFGIYYSYTRAAWIGVMVAACLTVPLLLRIKFNTLIIIAFSFAAFVFVFQNQIVYLLSKNQQKSADGFTNHFQSISNIKTDPSNTERINRWVSAINMFEEKPVLGFGPGTYSFCYAPFQKSQYLTEISTNFGDGGNAHSEYLNPLAESGVFGLLTYLVVIYFVFSTGFRLYYTAPKFKVRIISISVILGFATYFVHGFLNNYIESDKIAALFWGGFGVLTALDIYHNKQKNNSQLD